MNYEELAFANQQLAGMLRTGIPLEGALKQLSADMRRGRLREELEKLEVELARGEPLQEAISKAELPDLYRQMVRVGIAGNDLPGVLILLADYYHRMHWIWTRLKGLMVYPLIVLVAATGLSGLIVWIIRGLWQHAHDASVAADRAARWQSFAEPTSLFVMLPVFVLAGLAVAVVVALAWPRMRLYLRWRLPGFKEAAVTQLASAFALLLQSGCTLRDAVHLMKLAEKETPMGDEMARWESRMAEGHGKVQEIGEGGKLLPPLFFWIVASSGEDSAGGFRKAADLYYARALFRVEMFLYAALPVSVLILGLMILCQLLPLTGFFTVWIDHLGGE